VKYVPPDGLFGIQIIPNSISVGAPPRALLGELTTLPQIPESAGRGYPLPFTTPSTPPASPLASRLGAFSAQKQTLVVASLNPISGLPLARIWHGTVVCLTHRLVCYSLSMQPIFCCDVFVVGSCETTQTDNAHSTATQRHPTACTFIACHHLSLDAHHAVISDKHIKLTMQFCSGSVTHNCLSTLTEKWTQLS